ncbi:MAG: hypothetical protein HQL69_07085 [Magnetococcales bacterium]|nr:hypothetical protein [Magnetococcales bacterium]
MDENNNNSMNMEELTLEDEPQPIMEEAVAPEEFIPEPIYVPVESLGSGVVNALADMVGGLVVLKGSAQTKIKEGVDIIKSQVTKSNLPNSVATDGVAVEQEQAVSIEPEHVIAVEPVTQEQIAAMEQTEEQTIEQAP